MSSKTKNLLDEALQLSPAEREALAGKLFDSLATDDSDADFGSPRAVLEAIAAPRTWIRGMSTNLNDSLKQASASSRIDRKLPPFYHHGKSPTYYQSRSRAA
jgi:hypothetical protein